MTTFGLIIALGILVDDAVVVGESVFEERRKGGDNITGTERGVERVAVATVFGVLTTIAAFYPMLLIDNPLGKVLAGFSGIVILALIFSLIESKFILPAHLARVPLDGPRRYLLTRLWGRLQDGAQGGLMWFRDHVYRPALEVSVRHRYAVLILFVAAGALGLGLMAKGKIRTVFFPDVPGQVITVNLEMDARAPFALTRDKHGLDRGGRARIERRTGQSRGAWIRRRSGRFSPSSTALAAHSFTPKCCRLPSARTSQSSTLCATGARG